MKYARKDLVLPFRTAAGFGIQGGIYDQYIYVETLRCALPEDVAFAFNRTSSFSGRKVFFRMREDPALRTLIFSSIATRHSTRLDSTSLGGAARTPTRSEEARRPRGSWKDRLFPIYTASGARLETRKG
jgi:hypothetical protein